MKPNVEAGAILKRTAGSQPQHYQRETNPFTLRKLPDYTHM